MIETESSLVETSSVMAGIHVFRMISSVLTFLFICLIQTIYSAPLSSYLVSSFTSPDPNLHVPFNHITINNVTGDVYIGALERLYQLNSDLTLKHTVDTGTCPSPNEGNSNDNKLLVVAPSPEDKLITCGGCDGHCETRSLTNISHDVVKYNGSNEQLVVTTDDALTVGVVVLGADFQSEGVGVRDGGLYLFTGVSRKTGNDPSVSKHRFDDLEGVQRITGSPPVYFQHVIASKGYLFYFINRGATVYVGRLCPNSLDTALDSYTEIELECRSHSEIQTAHIGPAGSQLTNSFSIDSTDDLLYAVFSDGSSSVLCVYKMSDVLQSFEDAVLGCIYQGDSRGVPNTYLGGSFCDTVPSMTALPDTIQCTANYLEDGTAVTYYQYPSGVDALSASPIITIPDVILTSIVTTIERQHTVAFMGDTQGNVQKVNIVNSSFAYVYETVPLGSGSVLQEMFLDESKEEITVATSSVQGSKVLTLELTNCGQYETCNECIGEDGGNDGDPYCGWCTLKARCTRYEACPFPDESSRWLSYNALQCVSISEVQPNTLPFHLTEQEITITVQQLPVLTESYQYGCAFDSYKTSATTTSNTVTCTSPPETEVPSIPDGLNHVTSTLSIVSTETNISFVGTDFIFFDCSHIKSCSSCVTSPYPCDWCVYDNECTDDSSSCQSGETVVLGENNPEGTGNRGQAFCPQLLGATEMFLIPVSIPSGYSLAAKNLPTRDTTYECILNIEGVEERVSSTTFTNDNITCDDREYLYNENILQKNVSVSVQWNGQNTIDDLSQSHVTLYKCSVNSGSCSRCLSQEATPSILECGWCGDDCNVIESDVCQSNGFLHQNETERCSAPIITDFNPLSGPVGGRTRLEIIGTDLGVNFDDVQQILIQGIECDLTDMGMFYQPGQSVSCTTGISTESISGLIEITVMSGVGTKTGMSSDRFQYRDPIIAGFTPREGPVAGGTEITISGTYLNTGRVITATFGEAECTDISFQDTTATCITGMMPDNEEVSVSFTMTFDGVVKQFEEYTFTYMPNPRIKEIDRTASIMSGGTDIQLTGDRFDLIQEPRIVVTSLTTNASNSELCNGTETLLICPTPTFPDDVITARRRRATDEPMTANLTFDFDGYIIDGGTIEYFPDPVYESFSGADSIYDNSGNNRLVIVGMNLNLASTENDVKVFLGPDGECFVDDLEVNELRCQLPDTQPTAGDLNGTLGEGATQNLPAVVVKHGNLWFYPGFVKYSPVIRPPLGPIIGGTVGGSVVIIIAMVMLGVLMFKRRQKAIDQQVEELELLEKKIQNRAEEAYHNLQVDMTEVEEQVRGLGIPFVNTQDYARNMLFSGLDILPATADPEYLDADLERAMITFSRQLNNPDFLIQYIQELEERRKSHRRDRVNIASLITVILVSEGKFDYFTKILKRLLEESISDAADTDRPIKSLFRRTETIVEKLLANWMSLCMYHYLKKNVARSLYLLYQSIKIQVEKGPIDIITGQSYFSLNFDCLIEEDVPYEEMSLSVVGSDGQHEYYVKVLTTDCITQAKQKILDAAYRRQHCVKQNRAHELDLLWYHPGGEQRILRDQDEYNKPKNNSMFIHVNTLKSAGVSTDCRVAVISKLGSLENSTGNYTPVSPGAQMFYIYDQQGSNDVRERDYTRVQTHREEGYQLCHLIQEEQLQDAPSRTKLDKEFSAPHLLVTKKTIEPFLNQFLAAIFENPDLTPNTIKNLFDFFDGMAAKYCPDKPHEYSEAWKSNSLPQHYWVTTLTHPSYIFDMRQSRSADQSVSVLANMLDNACKKIIPERNEDSSLNRVLFVKDLPRYIKTIGEYYKNLASRPEPTHIELQGEFNRLGQEFSGLFSRVGTLKLLYDFTCQDTAGLLDSITEMM